MQTEAALYEAASCLRFMLVGIVLVVPLAGYHM